jgi:hypothetical protein
VKNQIDQYKAMRDMFRRAAASKNAADFDKMIATEGDAIVDRHSKAVAKLDACQPRFPKDVLEKDPIALKRWTLLGWGFKELPDGNFGLNWSATTNMQTCKLREDQTAKSREIVACLDLAESTEAHERTHVRQCEDRKKRNLGPGGYADHAAHEAAGYEAGIKKLEATLKRLTNKKCKEPIAQTTGRQDPAIRVALKKSIDAAAKRIDMFNRAKGA